MVCEVYSLRPIRQVTASPLEKNKYAHTANLCTKILDFRGFEPSIILSLRFEIPRPKGNLQEFLSQQILVGRFLVGRLGVKISAVTAYVMCVSWEQVGHHRKVTLTVAWL